MKTLRRNSPSEKHKNFFVRHLYIIVMATTLLVVASAVTLAIMFNINGEDTPTATPPSPPVASTYVVPLQEYDVVLQANLTELVYNPNLEEWRTVNGTVFGVKQDSQVNAIRDGKVVDVIKTDRQGTVVKIQHDDSIVSHYISLADDVAVTVGQDIQAGDKLGTTSSANQQYEHLGNQLYLEVLQSGQFIDPMSVLTV
jgi:murein DD-endopeptidase MepM/ murein hydrolase activator NlpD